MPRWLVYNDVMVIFMKHLERSLTQVSAIYTEIIIMMVDGDDHSNNG